MAIFKRNPKRAFREEEEASVNVFGMVVALAAITLTCFLIYALLRPVLFGEQKVEIIPFGADEPGPTATVPPTLAPTFTPPPAATPLPAATPIPARIRPGNVDQLRQVATLPGHGAAVSSVVYAPDGARLASGDWSGAIRVWDTATRATVYTFQSGSNRVDALAFSPDGATLVAVGQDTQIRRWNALTGEPLAPFGGPVAAVRDVAYSPDGAWIAAASDDGMVYLLNAASGALQALLTGHTDYVTSVAFDPSGTSVAAGGADDTIRLWSVPSGIELATLTGHTSAVTDLAYSPDGSLLASVAADHTLRLWSVLSASPIQTLEGHTENVTSVAFNPDGTLIATGAGGISDNRVGLWGVAERAQVARLDQPGPVTALDFSPDGMTLAVGGATFLTLWSTSEEAAPPATLQALPTATPPAAVAPAAEQGVQTTSACTLIVRLPEVTLHAAPDETSGAVGTLAQDQQVPLAAWARGEDGYTWWLLATGGWARGDTFVSEASPTLPDECWTLPPASAVDVPQPQGTPAAPAVPAGAGCMLTVRVANANVRAGPDTGDAVLEQLAEGAQVQAVGWTSGAEGFTWWQLASGGWARGDVFITQSLPQDCLTLPRVTP